MPLGRRNPCQCALQPTSLSLVSLSVDVGKSPHVPYVYVSHHGEVQNLKPIQVMTACSLDIYNFPFDVQNCSLTFTTWLHHSECRDAHAWGTRGSGQDLCWAGARCRRHLVPLDGPSGSGKRAGRAGTQAGAEVPAVAGAVGRVPPVLTSPPPPPVRDINLSLWRQPELVKFDRSVFMNQGEWELLYVLSHFQEFSVKSSDSYAEMKFYVRAFGLRVSRGCGTREGACPKLCAAAPACRWEAPAGREPFLWLTLVPPTILTCLGKEPHQLKASFQPFTAFSVSVLQVVIRRRPLFYTVSLLLPSIFLMVMDVVGFYLPPHSGERVSFKITLLLGYSVFLIIVSDTLPATAVGTPLIGTAGSAHLSGCHGSHGHRTRGPEGGAGRIRLGRALCMSLCTSLTSH